MSRWPCAALTAVVLTGAGLLRPLPAQAQDPWSRPAPAAEAGAWPTPTATEGVVTVLAPVDQDAGPTVLPGHVLPVETLVQTLDNGLTLVVVPVDTPGVVAVQTWVDVGSRNEVAAGTTGYAHLLEHLMFEGSAELPRGERQDLLMELGAAENAWTSDDDTCYHLVAPAQSLQQVLWVEADRFKHLSITPAVVRREAGAVQGEFRKGRTDPEELLLETLFATAFEVHGYGHSTIGLADDVAAMGEGYETVQAFRAANYRPDRATLVVTGDVEPPAVLDVVMLTYADWAPLQGFEPAPRDPQVEPRQQGERRAEVRWTAGPTDPRLVIGWRVPGHVPGTPTDATLAVISELLGATVAPLRRGLVDERQLAWSLEVEAPRRVDPSLFTVSVVARRAEDLPAIEAAVLQAVAGLAAGPPDPVAGERLDREVEAAREHLRRSAVLALDDAASVAFAVGRAARFRHRPTDLEADLFALERVQASDVQRVAATLLGADARTVVTLASAPAEGTW